jgi:hypothetical protein
VSSADALEVEAELVVDGCEVVREVEGEAVLLGGVGADVVQDVEVEGVLLGEREGLIGDLWGNGDHAGASCGNPEVVLLEGALYGHQVPQE